jgi:NAD(P)H-hydrate epimerase
MYIGASFFHMKIFSPEQVRDWDRYTIAQEPIASAALMERAAGLAADWILQHYPHPARAMVFCGPGNNGGDGIVIARRLWQEALIVDTWLLDTGQPLSPDAATHLATLQSLGAPVHRIRSIADIPAIQPADLVIDALWGSGLNRAVEGLGAACIEHINAGTAPVISIDLPSGLFPKSQKAITATHTLSFQSWKLPFFFPENDRFTGQIHTLDIGLHQDFYQKQDARLETTGTAEAMQLLKPRPRSGHKGSFGHAALLSGSWGMLGATILAAEACLRSGAGKLTCLVTDRCYPLLQTAVPEAVYRVEPGQDYVTDTGFTGNFAAMGFGPGCGVHPEQAMLATGLFRSGIPLVMDADALNLMVAYPELLERIPAGSILTPHPREFDALTFKHVHTADRMETAMERARAWKSVIVLKGHHTLVATPEGKGFFNMSGNAGMATAGSGDVLTGLLTGLLAQGYSPVPAARLGVFLHGLAGDIAAAAMGQEAMLAGDIVRYLGAAWQQLRAGSAGSPGMNPDLPEN